MFITFEGGEGSGKTTLLRRIQQWYQLQGQEVVPTREPGGTSLGDEIRSLLLESGEGHGPKICPRAELLLFLGVRAQHVHEKIKPALEAGKVVLCDRFSDSTVAYQGFARELGMAETLRFCEFAENGLVPDVTLYLDIDPVMGLERAKRTLKDERNDRFENEVVDFHKKVRKGFLTLADLFPQRIRILDATKSPDEVFDQAIQVIKHVQKAN